jgi:hypothetical protein
LSQGFVHIGLSWDEECHSAIPVLDQAGALDNLGVAELGSGVEGCALVDVDCLEAGASSRERLLEQVVNNLQPLCHLSGSALTANNDIASFHFPFLTGVSAEGLMATRPPILTRAYILK